jgi:gluconate kinase
MIVNIRGTSGSGKSWVIKQLIQRFPVTPYDRERRGHVLNGNTFVLGPYLDAVATQGTGVVNRKLGQDEIQGIIRRGGGLDDDRRSQDDTCMAVRHAGCPNTLFEGLLVSGIYGRYRNMARELPDYRWVFLNTSLEQCIENIRARRRAAGKEGEFSTKATADKHRSVSSILEKARADGLQVWEVSSTEAVDLIEGWIA